LDRLVQETIGRVADEWTMLVLEVLGEHEVLRFGELAELIGDVSQRMRAKTLRTKEQDGS
jgi:DNA-binding HxlR family transcriptional regulator